MPNKGEWGEPYAALKILGERKLYIADENGNRNIDEWMDIIELIRHETQTRLVAYKYNANDVDVDIFVDGSLILSVAANEFLDMADTLSNEIQSTVRGPVNVSTNVLNFLNKIEMQHIKALSVNKSDLFLTVRDPRAGITRNHIGFSIKSEFGKDPTLFNTAKASALIYRLCNMNDNLMNEINNIFDSTGHVAVSERCNIIMQNNCSPVFVGFPVASRARCAAFSENLDLIDNRLITVFDRLLYKHFFEHFTVTDINNAVDIIIAENPCRITRPEIKYPYMIKSFLYAAYCGMTASTLWNGMSQVNGGFIKVKADGDVVACYALESDAFKQYLYDNCYLEFPDTDVSHGNYGNVYVENGNYFFRLNFSIRYR